MPRLLYSLCWLVSLLPMWLLYGLSDCVYPVVRFIVRYRRNVIRQNLASAFPEKTTKELRRIEAGFYHQLCDCFVENIKVTTMSRRQMMRRMTFGGLDTLRETFASGQQFAFVFLGHLGNWEWIASLQYWLADVHCTQIYHRLRNRAADEFFLRNRQKYGGECIKMKNTLRRLVALRKDNRKVVVGFIADQQPKWNAIHHFTPFLNHDTAVFTGTEHIAKTFGASVFYGHVTRLRRGHYHCEFIRITDTPSAFPDFDLTDRYMQMLEQDIRLNPSLWLWSHKRWSRTKEQWLKRQGQA